MWWPCCCNGSRFAYTPCCVSGIYISVLGRANDGLIRDEFVSLSRNDNQGILKSADHALQFYFPTEGEAGLVYGSRRWYFFGLDPVTIQDVFIEKPGFNWSVELRFWNTSKLFSDIINIRSIQLGFSYLNNTSREDVVYLFPKSVSAPGWQNVGALLNGNSLASCFVNPCSASGTIIANFGKVDWHQVFHYITEQTQAKHVLFKIPIIGGGGATEDLCMQRLEPTTDPVSNPVVDQTVPDCDAGECDNKCSCDGLMSDQNNSVICSPCNCVEGVPLRTGGYGDIHPQPNRYVIDDQNDRPQLKEFTVYCWSRDNAEQFPSTIYWKGLKCWDVTPETSNITQKLKLSREDQSTVSLTLWTDLGQPIHISVGQAPALFPPEHTWFFWAIRKKEVPGGFEYKLWVNNGFSKTNGPELAPHDWTIIGDSGISAIIPIGSQLANESFAGCYSGLTLLPYAVSDEFLQDKYNLGCTQT